MLKFTRKVEYALIALRYPHSKPVRSLANSREIAEAHHIPVEHLAKTLQLLARNHIVEAVQGPSGGYRISTDLTKINWTEFLEKIEGPLAVMDCYYDSECTLLTDCNIRTPIQKINDSIRSMFSNMTVSEVMN